MSSVSVLCLDGSIRQLVPSKALKSGPYSEDCPPAGSWFVYMNLLRYRIAEGFGAGNVATMYLPLGVGPVAWKQGTFSPDNHGDEYYPINPWTGEAP